MFHASVTVRQCDPDPGWQHPPSVMSQIKMFSLLGEQRGSAVLKKKKKRKEKGAGGGHPSSTLTALPNPIFFLLLPLTHLLPVATCQHTRTHKTTQWTMWKRAGGFRKNKLPSLTFNETPPRHCCDRGERKKKKKKKWTEGKMEIPDKEKYLPLVSLLKSKASTIKV